MKQNLSALLRLAGPIALSQIAQVSMGFVDTVMVGRLTAVDLAAVSLGSSTFFAVLVISLGTITAVGPLVSQASGARDDASVGQITRQGLWLALLLTPLVVVLLWGVGRVLPYLGPEAAVTDLAARYLAAVSFSVLPFLGFVALRSWIEALNRPLPVTAFAISAVGVNIVANYCLVYGRFGFPQLGAVGTGFATSLSYTYLFVGLAVYVRSREYLRHYAVFAGWGPPDWGRLGELLRVGVPIGASFGIEVGLFSITAILAGGLGTVPLAAHQIAVQLASMAFMIPLSVALAVSIRVGNLVGAGGYAEARQAGWLSIGLGAGVMCGSAALFTFLPDPLVALFLGEAGAEKSGVASLAVELLALAGIFQVVDGTQATASGSLRGLKDTFVPMLIGLGSYWGVGLTSGYLLSRTYGAPGLWTGLCLGLATAAVLMTWRWGVLSRGLVDGIDRNDAKGH